MAREFKERKKTRRYEDRGEIGPERAADTNLGPHGIERRDTNVGRRAGEEEGGKVFNKKMERDFHASQSEHEGKAEKKPKIKKIVKKSGVREEFVDKEKAREVYDKIKKRKQPDLGEISKKRQELEGVMAERAAQQKRVEGTVAEAQARYKSDLAKNPNLREEMDIKRLEGEVKRINEDPAYAAKMDKGKIEKRILVARQTIDRRQQSERRGFPRDEKGMQIMPGQPGARAERRSARPRREQIERAKNIDDIVGKGGGEHPRVKDTRKLAVRPKLDTPQSRRVYASLDKQVTPTLFDDSNAHMYDTGKVRGLVRKGAGKALGVADLGAKLATGNPAEAAKAVADEAISRTALKAAGNVAAKYAPTVARVAGRVAVPLAVAATAYDVGRAAKEGYKAFSARKEAKAEKAGSEAKYGTVEAATRTRKRLLAEKKNKTLKV